VLNVKRGLAAPAVPPPSASSPSIAAARSIDLVWPAQGKSRRGTSAAHSQGVYIAAAAGSPIKAAASGKVMYAGSGLRGYGNMLIVNHDANFISVYAHNDTLLVKEGASVRQGQTIATMGSTGTNTVNLYFELRYNGKAVDALRYLPKGPPG
jgi:murein DD-endopeptidase MepM/ murein hydrolase activator NlpD